MQEYSHDAFEVSGFKFSVKDQKTAAQDIQKFWDNFMEKQLDDLIQNKAYPTLHAVYYNYQNLGEETESYDMLVGFITDTGAAQTGDSEIITIQIPTQDYKYVTVEEDFETTIPAAWEKINSTPATKLDRDYGYDLEMYSEDFKTCTIAVSVNK